MSCVQTFDRRKRSRTHPFLAQPAACPNATSAATLTSKLSGLTSLPNPLSESSERFCYSTMAVWGKPIGKARSLRGYQPPAVLQPMASVVGDVVLWCMMFLHKAKDRPKFKGGSLLGHIWRIHSWMSMLPVRLDVPLPVCICHDSQSTVNWWLKVDTSKVLAVYGTTLAICSWHVSARIYILLLFNTIADEY